jgi:hypothetical protein
MLALAPACEMPGPSVRVTIEAAATVSPAYPVFVVLFRLFEDGKTVEETYSDVAGSAARARFERDMGFTDTLSVTAAVYWHRPAGDFVRVSDAESRTLEYGEAKAKADRSAGGELAYTWEPSMDLKVE